MLRVRDGVHVRQNAFQFALAAVGFVVLLTREPAEQIGRAVVEFVGDEMMDDADVGFAVLVRVGGAFAIESKRHNVVAVSVAELPHCRIAPPCITSGSGVCGCESPCHPRTERVCDFLSLRIEEIAVRVCP